MKVQLITADKGMKVQLLTADIPAIRNMVLEDQGGICLICKKKPTRPCLDHSHTRRIKGSGLVRGTLCSTCNRYVGKIENNATMNRIKQADIPRILRNIADYLEQPDLPYIHPSERGRV